MVTCDPYHEAVPEKFKVEQVSAYSKFGRFIAQQEHERRGKVHGSNGTNQLSEVTLLEILEKVVLSDKDIKVFLEGFSNAPSLQTRAYKSLWDIVIKLNKVPYLTSTLYKHYIADITKDIHAEGESDVYEVLKTTKVNDPTRIVLKRRDATNSADWACHQRPAFVASNDTNSFVVFTVTYYDKEKTMDNYGIQDIVHIADSYRRSNIPFNCDIVVCVKDKTQFFQRLRASKTKGFYEKDFSKIIDQVETNNVYDLQDLISFINEVRVDNKTTSVLKNIMRAKPSKPRLFAKFHQLMFVNKTIHLFENTTCKTVLWGLVARSGKTYTAGALISKMNDRRIFQSIRGKGKGVWVLVITPAPSETKSQFKEELFEKFADFESFKVEYLDGRFKKDPKPEEDYIFVASKQFLQMGKTKSDVLVDIDESVADKLGKLQNKVDMIIFDEVHMGGTTDISQYILQVLDEHKKCLRVFLTATYNKPFHRYDIKPEELMTWTLEDVELCKNISNRDNFEVLKSKFSADDVRSTILEMKMQRSLTTEEMLQEIEREYKKFPKVSIITSAFQEDKIEKIKSNNPNEYGFDMKSIFLLTNAKGQREFQNVLQMQQLLEYVGGNLLMRVNKTIKDYSTNHRSFSSQLWFVPYFEQNCIVDVAHTLKAFMETDDRIKHYFKDYGIFCATEKREGTYQRASVRKDIYCGDSVTTKEDVKRCEIHSYQQGKKGIIILAGKKFSLGVSLPCVDVVVFLNDDVDVDVTYQRMFRSLTESNNKGIGFVVDLNPFRTISALLDYTTRPRNNQVANLEEKKETLFRMIKTKLILLDDDMIESNAKGEDDYKRLYDRLDTIIKGNYTKKIINESSETLGNKLFTSIHDVFMTDKSLSKAFNDKRDGGQKYELVKNQNKLGFKGFKKEHSKTNNDQVDVVLNSKEPKEKDNSASLYAMMCNVNDAFKDTIMIASLLFDNVTSVKDLLLQVSIIVRESISKRQVEPSPLSTQSKNKRTKEHVNVCSQSSTNNARTSVVPESVVFLDILRQRLGMVFKGSPINLNNVLYTFLEVLSSSSHDINIEFNNMVSGFKSIADKGDIKDIHAYVQSKLTPKKIESKLYGEVFTPLTLVNEMMDALEKYGDKDIWKNPNMKILDPAAGIGNFPLVAYERLMEGLKHKIPNEEKRRKHILEQMLYMVELNPTNVRIMKRIFGGDKYKLNVLTTDFLLETKEDIAEKKENLTPKQRKDGCKLLEWKRDIKFDLVMGNPPYNKRFGASGSGALPLYHVFINSIIDTCKTLNFVVPSRWFAGGKGLEDFRNFMLQRKDIVMIKTFKDSNEVFGNSVDIEGGVCYFIKRAGYIGLCMLNDKKTDLSKHDIVVDANVLPLIEKIAPYPRISSIYIPSSFFGLRTNDKRLQDEGGVVCYVSSKKRKNRTQYIDSYDFTDRNTFWKVLTPRANGSSHCFGHMFIAKPNTVFTDSYICFKCSKYKEAVSLVTFLQTKFVNFILSTRKISQDISEHTCKWIPLVPLDREWTDTLVASYFDLTKDEIGMIEQHRC